MFIIIPTYAQTCSVKSWY